MNENLSERKAIFNLMDEVDTFDNDDREVIDTFSEFESLEMLLEYQARRLVQQVFDSLERLRGLHSETLLQNTFKVLSQRKFESAFKYIGLEVNYFEFLVQAQIHVESLSTTRPEGHSRKLKGKLYRKQLELNV